MNKILSKIYPPISLHKEIIANRDKKKPLLPLPLHYIYYWYIRQPIHLIHSKNIVIGDNPLLAPLILLAQNIIESAKQPKDSGPTTNSPNSKTSNDVQTNNIPQSDNFLILEKIFTKPAIEPISIVTTNLDPWDYRFAFEENWIQALSFALVDFCKHFEKEFALIDCSAFEPPTLPDIEFCYNWIFSALKKFNVKFIMDIKVLPSPILPFAYITHPEKNITKLPSNQQKALSLLRHFAHKYDLLYSPLNCAMLKQPCMFFANNYHWNSKIPAPLVLPSTSLFSTTLYGRSQWDTNNPQQIHLNSRNDIFIALARNSLPIALT